jgi:hypothetical protein
LAPGFGCVNVNVNVNVYVYVNVYVNVSVSVSVSVSVGLGISVGVGVGGVCGVRHAPSCRKGDWLRRRRERCCMEQVPRSDASTTDLIREAIDDARQLVRVEVALASDEGKRELREAKTSLIGFGAGTVLAIVSLAMFAVALAQAISPSPWSAFIIACVLLALAAIAGAVGYQLLPTRPFEHTRRRLQLDARALRERHA